MANDCNVVLSKKAHERIKEYSDFTGISVERATSEAVSEWMDETGDLVMQEMERRRAARTGFAVIQGAKTA